MKGKIVRIISNLYTVDINSKKYDCRARGKFRKEEISPLVGDNVVVDIDNNYILDIEERKNELARPQIANVDYALIISSVKKPNLSLNLLDKQLAIIELNKIKPIIILTKLDLLNSKEKKEIKPIINYYKSIGYLVLKNTDKLKIKRLLKNKISVLTGQSGAGKSTLLNFLDKTLNLKTQEISKSLGRGIHTTRHVELFEINKCLIADTPGFSSLNFEGF
ncbi:MAG: ribosome small subunit-dependent GTPase A, partial [Bacilli bacterium]|nr:ribosome small subunit-dependent GTPase A [Bacilli bacterium]